ncbi:unnamed protein product, partial [Ilex paraguariensis]
RPKHNTAAQKSAQLSSNKHQANSPKLIKQNKNRNPSQVRKWIHSKPFAKEQQTSSRQAQAQHSSTENSTTLQQQASSRQAQAHKSKPKIQNRDPSQVRNS